MVSPATPPPEEAQPAKRKRPETFAEVSDRLGTLERLNISLIRRSFTSKTADRTLKWAQRHIGAGWVHQCTKNLLHVHRLERAQAALESQESFVLVANHRSFFDMYVINTIVYRAGFDQRLLYPVRSSFFYDHPLGFFVNGAMSWFSMYPPIFRDRKRVALNHVAMTELSTELTHSGRCAGIHPEGTRKRDDDPYTFLPAQPGVGRLIHLARVRALPVFVNGLGNDLKRQVKGNFDGTGDPILVVFGEPLSFEDLWAAPAGPRTYKAIAERCMDEIGKLGQEEKQLRAAL